MRLAIHQPHYFPWIGYLNKMAKVDKFILMDEVQLTDKSNMFRNKFLSRSGTEKLLTVNFEKKSYMEKPFKEVKLNSRVNWQLDHVNFLKDSYRKAPYFHEIWERIGDIFEKDYQYLCEVAIDSLITIKDLLEIPTELIFQSKLAYDHDARKNDLVLSLCKTAGAHVYLSGNGARKYMDLKPFENSGIQVEFQRFIHPQYPQVNMGRFVSNLSSLDLLFNCGLDKSRKIFWNSVSDSAEF